MTKRMRRWMMRALSRHQLGLALLVALCAGGAYSDPLDPPACAERVGHWGDGPVLAMAITDDMTLVGSGRVLGLLDNATTSPERPFVSEIHLGHGIQDIVVVGNLAYVAAGAAGLAIVDLSAWPELELVSELPTPTWAGAVAVDGDLVYVTHAHWLVDEGGLLIVDVGLPEEPWVIANLSIDGVVGGIALADQHAIVVSEKVDFWGWGTHERLHVVDVADPASPHEVGRFQAYSPMRYTFAWPLDVDVIGSYAVLPNVSEGRLLVIDLSSPTDPRQVATALAPSEVRKLALSGNHALVAGWRAVSIIDLSDPLDPITFGSWTTGYRSVVGSIAGHLESMLVGIEDVDAHTVHLLSFDVTDPLTLEPAQTRTWQGYRGGRIALTGDTALVAAREGGLEVLDLSRPQRVKRLSTWPTLGPALAVSVVGTDALVSTADGWLHRLDVSDPNRPSEVSSRLTGVAATDIDSGGDLVVLTDTHGLHILDVGPVASGAALVSYPLGGAATRTALWMPLAFVTSGHSLVVISLQEPARPRQVGRLRLPHEATDVAAHMGIVLVATDQAALHVLDGSDPTYPEELAVVPVARDPNSWFNPVLAVEWPLVTLCTVGAGCAVIDVSDPHHPSIAGTYPAPFWVEDAAADNGRIVLSEFTWTHSLDIRPEALTVLSTAACLGARGTTPAEASNALD